MQDLQKACKHFNNKQAWSQPKLLLNSCISAEKNFGRVQTWAAVGAVVSLFQAAVAPSNAYSSTLPKLVALSMQQNFLGEKLYRLRDDVKVNSKFGYPQSAA